MLIQLTALQTLEGPFWDVLSSHVLGALTRVSKLDLSVPPSRGHAYHPNLWVPSFADLPSLIGLDLSGHVVDDGIEEVVAARLRPLTSLTRLSLNSSLSALGDGAELFRALGGLVSLVELGMRHIRGSGMSGGLALSLFLLKNLTQLDMRYPSVVLNSDVETILKEIAKMPKLENVDLLRPGKDSDG